jgi:low temperature requirement protein LtrA
MPCAAEAIMDGMTEAVRDDPGVSTLELFFDLVFVFTITQLTALLLDDLSWHGVLGVLIVLVMVWWMYSGYAWLTNAVPPDRPSRRLPLLVGMAGFLVISLAIPDAFGDATSGGSGMAFALGYLTVVVVHLGLYTRSANRAEVLAILRIAAFNLLAPLVLLVGALVHGDARYALWGAACVLSWSAPYVLGLGGFEVRSGHFVERHGLVVIIALGESVVAVGIGAAGLAVDAELVLVAVLGLLLAAALWWVYFGGDDTRAERALAGCAPHRRALLAVNAWGYAHLPILFGVVAAAVGIKKAVGHAGEQASHGQALALAGGVALYLLGDAAFRALLRIGVWAWRVAAAALALATYPLGTQLNAGAQLGALVAVLAVALTAERLVQGPDIPRTVS